MRTVFTVFKKADPEIPKYGSACAIRVEVTESVFKKAGPEIRNYGKAWAIRVEGHHDGTKRILASTSYIPGLLREYNSRSYE